jgi:hypothetical protein
MIRRKTTRRGRPDWGRSSAIRRVPRYLRNGVVRLASFYAPRRWFVVVVGTCLALWLYSSAQDIAHVYDPPSEEGPTLDYVIPVAGTHRGFDDHFELDIEIGVRGCQNPVRVLADASGPYVGSARNWLRSRSFVSFGVGDASASDLHGFLVSEIPTAEEPLFNPDFHGTSTLSEIRGKQLAAPATLLNPGLRAGSGWAPAISLDSNPSLYWVFTADWLHPRSHGTCYLALPLVIGPGPGSPLLQLPRPPQGHYGGTSIASVDLTDWDFTEGDSGLDPAPLTVIEDDSKPAPNNPAYPTWTCDDAHSASCNGGYVALSTANATGNTNSALFLRGALLGVLAALVADSLLRFHWPGRRRHGSDQSHTGDLPIRWTRR